MEEIKNEIPITIIIAGEDSIGGTSFRESFIDERTFLNNMYFDGMDHNIKHITLANGEKIQCIFYNSGRAEIHQSILKNKIRYVDGILLMYNITKIRTFERIDSWLDSIDQNVGEIPIVLIGNMIDLEDHRQVSKEDGEEKAKKYNLHFYESSCKEYINIQEPVYDLLEQIYKIKKEKKRNNELENKEIILDKKKKNGKNKKNKKDNKAKVENNKNNGNNINNSLLKDNSSKQKHIKKDKDLFKVRIDEKQNKNIILDKIYLKYINL